MPIDAQEAERFITWLTGAPDTPCVFQVFEDDKTLPKNEQRARIFIGSLGRHLRELSRWNDAGCGVGVQINAGAKRGKVHVTDVRAIFADDDRDDDALPVLPPLQPSLVVESSTGRNKRHFYWKLQPGAAHGRWEAVQGFVADSLDTDKAVVDLARIMRLPGSINAKKDPAKGRDGTLFRVRIVEETPAAYDLETVATAFAPRGPTIDFDAGTFVDADGKPVEMPGVAPAPTGDYTADALKVARRVRRWLVNQKIDFDRRKNKNRAGYFVLRNCVFNAAHVDSMAVIVRPDSGGIFCGCFHDTCGGNAQRWDEVKDKVGSWDTAGVPGAFLRGDHAELAVRLLEDLSIGSTEDLVAADGALWRYSPISGIWTTIDDAHVSCSVQTYAGRAIGANGQRVKIYSSDVAGTLRLASDRVAQHDFFTDRTPGIAFANGFLRADPHGVTLEPFMPTHRAQVAMPFAYDQQAERPRFDAFLKEIFEPDEDAELKIRLLQEHVGAALLGLATRYECALFLPGTGSNGKSRMLSVLRALFPKGAVASVRPSDFSKEYYRARLAGARLNLVFETPESETISSESFKAIVSGDLTDARHPSGRVFDFVPIAAHWFAANTLPPPGDVTWGFWRKVTILPFNRTFTANDRDEYVADYMIDNELAGIAAWAVEGARRLCVQRGFTEVASSEEAKKAWRTDADVVMAFLDECCKLPEGALPPLDTETAIDDLYRDFQAWCRHVGQTKFVLSRNSFARRLGALGYKRRQTNSKRLYPVIVHSPPPTECYL